MSMSRQHIRRNPGLERLYAALQAARRARGWDDAMYYGRLATVTGRPITSTQQLNRAEAARCLDDINGAHRHRARPAGGAGPAQDSRAASLAALRRRLAATTGADGNALNDGYAEGILRRMRGIHDHTVSCPLALPTADGGERILASAQELRALHAALDTFSKRHQPDGA